MRGGFFLAGVIGMLAGYATLRADGLDDLIGREMSDHGIPGLSLAVVRDGKIVLARGYGVAGSEVGSRVLPETLFQAASISKTLSALGALIEVSRGVLSLDGDVNERLKSWKVPESKFTAVEKVTVRRILSHSAGLNVHGFPGYEAGAAVPSLKQILNGERPAKTKAIVVESTPGTRWQYSGGGYEVLQQLIEDATDEPFEKFMRETVLEPLGMKRSTFQQPLPQSRVAAAAMGRMENGKVLPGGWHVYPELAAAGLWTTPSDLGLFLIALQRALQGKTDGPVSNQIALQMVTPVLEKNGMGFQADGGGTFSHGGRNAGFDSLLVADRQIGVVVMINGNDDTGVLTRVAKAALRQYSGE